MPIKITTTDFINKATIRHGKIYDYSKVIYINNSTPVIIICKKHGEFLQKPYNHTRGSGCKKCFRERDKYDFKTFVSKAREVHGEKYKYPYQKIDKGISKTKVLITCFKHGDFEQLGTQHLTGRGCYECGLETISEKGRIKVSEFLFRSKEIHRDRYIYDLVDFQGVNRKVKIICKEHGMFEQTPDNHMNGQNCPRCGQIQTGISGRITFKEFKKRAREVHGEKYNYISDSYTMVSEKVSVICHDHGEFKINGTNHLNGEACYNCGIEKIRDDKLIPLEEIKKNLRVKYEDRYVYDFSDYVDTSTPVSIKCPDHGYFKSTIKQHLRSPHGCPSCSNEARAESQILPFANYKERFIQKHGKKYKYNENSFKSGSAKMEIICDKHGAFDQAPLVHQNGHGCPRCKSSTGENLIRILLENKEIDFEEQKVFEGLRDKRPLFVDFYINKINTVIEYNGIQHYEAFDFFGGEKSFKNGVKKDKIKMNYCNKNGINFEVIRYDEDVQTRMNEILEKYS